jgi:hypothetical protein
MAMLSPEETYQQLNNAVMECLHVLEEHDAEVDPAGMYSFAIDLVAGVIAGHAEAGWPIEALLAELQADVQEAMETDDDEAYEEADDL